MDLVDPLRLVAAVLVVAGLVALLVVLARRLERLRAGARGRRLAVLETCWLDGRNRLVLVRCDAAEHLLLVGQSGARPLATSRPEGRG